MLFQKYVIKFKVQRFKGSSTKNVRDTFSGQIALVVQKIYSEKVVYIATELIMLLSIIILHSNLKQLVFTII